MRNDNGELAPLTYTFKSPITYKERLFRAAKGESVDRPPCICPGGMMNDIVREIMEESGCSWPESHYDPEKMAKLTLELYLKGGFENCGVPFCMTVEAEAMGAIVDIGDMDAEPHVVKSALNSTEDVNNLKPLDLNSGRVKTVLDAIKIIKREDDTVPVIGNITGPISTAGQLVDMGKLLIESRKKPEACHKFIDAVTENLIKFARAQIEAGADVICIAEPSGTGEILGAELFRDYTIRYLNKILDKINGLVPVRIVHICGKLRSVYSELSDLHCDVFSMDSVVDMQSLREYMPNIRLMGNVSTHAIGTMPSEKIMDLTVNAVRRGADIVAPACGLPVSTPLNSIRSMVNAVRVANLN